MWRRMTDHMVAFTEVTIDSSEILDWPTFHAVFTRTFGFPDFYGRNMNAWIDCMTDLDDPGTGMTQVHAPPNGIVLIKLLNAKEFSKRCPDQAAALTDCTAFVNWRRREQGNPPVLALSYRK